MQFTKFQSLHTKQIMAVLKHYHPKNFSIAHSAVIKRVRELFPDTVGPAKAARSGGGESYGYDAVQLTIAQTTAVLRSFKQTASVIEALEAGTLATSHNPAQAAVEAPSAVTVYRPVMEADMPVAAPNEVVGVQDKPLTSVADIGIETGSIAAGDTVQTVNARKLHSFLQVGKKFTDWIKEQSEKYGFAEGKDFVVVQNLASQNGEASHGGHNRVEYHVTLDMAKSLAMVSRTEKGKEARDYFIDCEKKAVMGTSPVALPTYSEALRQLANSLETTERQQAMIDVQSAALIEQAPAVEFVDKYVGAKGAINFRAVAKLLQAADPAVTEIDFRAFLESNRIMYKLGDAWTAYAPHIKAGYFMLKTTVVEGYERSRALFTPAGVKWVTEKWNKRMPKLRK